jgi:hypothetical protein
VLAGIVILALIPHWRKRDRRRQEAVNQTHSSIMLFSNQPTPNEVALLLPVVFAYQLTLKNLLLCFGKLLPILLLMGAGLILLGTAGKYGDIIAHPLFFLFWDLMLSSIAAFVLIARARESIILTDSGMQVSRYGSTRSILWSEARLFAIYAGKRAGLPEFYELSSSTSIVRWRRLRRKTGFFSTKFGLSSEEYTSKMDALLSVIAAKTNLGLYDLR